MELTDGQLGWLAGVLDCDSCIYITRAARKNRPSPYNYRLEVTVEGVDPRKPYECYRLTGVGTIAMEKIHPEGATKSNTVKWRTRGKALTEVLKKVRPLMVAKGEQVDLALEFLLHVKDHWSDMEAEDMAFQQWAYEEMPRLKQRHSLGRTLWALPTA